MNKRVDSLSTDELAALAQRAGEAALDYALKNGVWVAGYIEGRRVEVEPISSKATTRPRRPITPTGRKAG